MDIEARVTRLENGLVDLINLYFTDVGLGETAYATSQDFAERLLQLAEAITAER